MALALLFLCLAAASSAQAPQPKAEAQQGRTASQSANAAVPSGPVRVEIVNQAADPAGYQEPCKGDESDRNSDLCAQWTAANGARDAAYYAKLQLWAAAAGMAGLVLTLILTLQAVKAAKASVATQIEAERPLVQIDGLHAEALELWPDRPSCIGIDWKLKNHGRGGCWIERLGVVVVAGRRPQPPVADKSVEIMAFVGPGETINADMPIKWWASQQECKTVELSGAITLSGFVEYRDASARVWRTHFLFELKVGPDYRSISHRLIPSAVHWKDGRVD